MNNRIASLLCCIALVAAPAGADQEAPNAPCVTASKYGDRYAKSIPDDRWGMKGRTRIYRVERDADTLEHEFDWYARTVHLFHINEGTSVVRFGPWTRGYEAKKDDLALAFYLNGKLLRSYSTLDIAREAENVRQTVSHYTWSSHVHGYCSLKSPDGYQRIGFALETIDGRTLSFDVSTGEVQPTWRPVEEKKKQ